MSIRSSRRLQQINALNNENCSPAAYFQNILLKSSSAKGSRSGKKVKNTKESFCVSLDFPTESKENSVIYESANTQKYTNMKKIRRTHELFNLDSPNEEKNEHFKSPVVEDLKRRKIVRAKRLLSKSELEENKQFQKRQKLSQKQNSFVQGFSVNAEEQPHEVTDEDSGKNKKLQKKQNNFEEDFSVDIEEQAHEVKDEDSETNKKLGKRPKKKKQNNFEQDFSINAEEQVHEVMEEDSEETELQGKQIILQKHFEQDFTVDTEEQVHEVKDEDSEKNKKLQKKQLKKKQNNLEQHLWKSAEEQVHEVVEEDSEEKKHLQKRQEMLHTQNDFEQEFSTNAEKQEHEVRVENSEENKELQEEQEMLLEQNNLNQTFNVDIKEQTFEVRSEDTKENKKIKKKQNMLQKLNSFEWDFSTNAEEQTLDVRDKDISIPQKTEELTIKIEDVDIVNSVFTNEKKHSLPEQKHTKEINKQNCINEMKFDHVSVIELSDESSGEPEGKISNSFGMVITTLEKLISPSTSNVEHENGSFMDMAQTSAENVFHFETSKEELQPSTSGLVQGPTSKRRTYELETSITDVSLLKSISNRDSTRINTFPKIEKKSLSFTNSKLTDSNVTRRKFLHVGSSFDVRLSKFSPPWKNEKVTNPQTTPNKTSTPMSVKKGSNLLKNVLTEDLSAVKSPPVKKHGSSVKIPNFAAIHQKALDKMESLSEYKQRKEQRAKMLLSGKKPLSGLKKETKKRLRFAPNVSDKEKSFGFIPLPSTPMPRRVHKSVDSPATADKTEVPKKIQTPKFNFGSPSRNGTPKFNFEIKENLFLNNTRVVSSKNKCDSPKIERVLTKILTPRNNKVKPEVFKFGNNYNRFGFHIAKPVVIAKKDEIKTIIATKSKPMKNAVDARRVVIKGVRSNRRFDLLMNMRKGK